MNKKWTPEEAMVVWGDLLCLEENGCWKDKYPEWAAKIASRLFLPESSLPQILLMAYKQVAETFIDEYIKAGKDEQGK